MTPIIADRFVQAGSGWLDLATGAAVRVRIAPAGTIAQQLAWAARCDQHAALRHPLLNPLVDYGLLDETRTFEAYDAGAPIAASGDSAATLLGHVVCFLEAHGIALPHAIAALAVRGVVAPSPLRRRRDPALDPVVGLVIQRRAAFEAIADALDAAEPAGTAAVAVAGPAHAGLRTARVMAARAARLRGYVPVSAAVLAIERAGLPRFDGRHLCVLVDECAGTAEAGTAAAALARIPAIGGRRHLMLIFARQPCVSRPAVELEPMGLTSLTAMVFTGSPHGPEPGQVMAAARHADGMPGLMLARLRAQPFDAMPTLHAMVRETAPSYRPAAPEPAPDTADIPERRTAAVLNRSAARAGELARRGRHAAAGRALARAFRLLVARGDRAGAARCALAAGRLALDRGRTEAALRAFDQARDLAPDGRLCLEAAIGIGMACLEDARLVDAEGTCRTAWLAATTMGEAQLAADAGALLAESLRLQGRADEAAALPILKSGQPATPRLAAAAARVHLALEQVPSALRAARDAVAQCCDLSDPAAKVDALRTLAAALHAVGDAEGARARLLEAAGIARSAHLPLETLRIRIAEVGMVSDTSGRRTRAARLQPLARRGLPRLLRSQIESVCARAIGETGLHGGAALTVPLDRRGPVAELEALLGLSHNAADDSAAILAVCTDVCRRLRAIGVAAVSAAAEARVLAMAGRPGPSDIPVARRVLAGGISVAPDPLVEPAHAGEPIRYGGELIGALVARWPAGIDVDADRASALLRVGALAVAASVRAVLDRATPQSGAPRPDDIIGDSACVRALRDAIARAARAPFPVLIEGESGSGKELVARAIHRLGPRRDRRFCTVNCAALTDELLEAELFGHTRGAFTGAVGERAGLFEDADGGTIFLDEIGELSPRAQAKLLRVLQDGEVRRVGENMSRRVDVRVVAATNRRLAREAEAGRFRADLRFRLDVVRLDVPPLRERAGDVALLAVHFWADAAARVGSHATLAPAALAALSRYDWPGNVRELQNVMAWMAVHSPRRGRVGPAALPAHIAQGSAPCGGTFEAARSEFERRFVRAALAAANGQRASAAAAIGVSRQGLAKMLRRLGIEGHR